MNRFPPYKNNNHNHNHNQNQNQNSTLLNSIGVNPTLWGPLIWNLLHEFSKLGSQTEPNLNIESNINDFRNIIKALPYILPCSICRSHVSQAYNSNKISTNLDSCKDFKIWVWKMKSISNSNTGTTSISLDQYSDRISTWSRFTSEEQIFDLLFIMAHGYPQISEQDINRQQYYYLFLKSIANLCGKIDYLKNINKFIDEIQKMENGPKINNINNKKELTTFFSNIYTKIYEKQYNYNKIPI